ncbi:DNA (cytosine-5)-methyltransferase CMT3-like, partial [Cucurbita pepo subsp. pepo]|uniref:DNA (cytosine-5)-methyltransferase CMT3-like n=1 Tax=Cucurbita pepo subsp. pepo TaxID=3664 RepID=UPI000C9D9151
CFHDFHNDVSFRTSLVSSSYLLSSFFLYLFFQKKKVAGAKNSRDDSVDVVQALHHYSVAEVDNIVYNLFDDAHVKAEDGEDDYICRIVEMFEAVDGQLYFTAQWYYRAKDTVVKDHAHLINDKRVFFSEVRDDNPLDCLVRKLNIARIPLTMATDKKKKCLPVCDFHCDMLYLLPYSTFVKLPASEKRIGSDTSSTISSEVDTNGACEVNSEIGDVTQAQQCCKPDVTLLDLYSGCGAMSTGLCLGANLSGVNLVTKWAVDINQYACESVKFNHPETEVRNEMAEDFLSLLKEWEVLCKYFSLVKSKEPQQKYIDLFANDDEEEEEEEEDEKSEDDGEVFEVEKVLAICYGDPNETKKRGLFLKVRNEMAEDFLSLLKEWEVLCKYFSLVKSKEPQQKYIDLFANDDEEEEEEEEDEKSEDDGEVFEVEKVLAICYGDPNETKKRGLFLK